MGNQLRHLLIAFITYTLCSPIMATTWVPIGVGDITIMIPINNFIEPEESRATMLGIDEDNDGVRDDIQAQINHRYANNAYLRVQSLQMAATYQTILTSTHNHSQINQKVADIEYINSCIKKNSSETDTGIMFVIPKQLNTAQRTRAYLVAARNAHHEEGPPAYRSCD